MWRGKSMKVSISKEDTLKTHFYGNDFNINDEMFWQELVRWPELPIAIGTGVRCIGARKHSWLLIFLVLFVSRQKEQDIIEGSPFKVLLNKEQGNQYFKQDD